METIVLDCSVAAKWFFPEPGRDAALSFFDRFAAGEILLIAPDLLLAEFASLLAKQVRRKIIPAERAIQFFDVMRQSAPQLFETPPLHRRALALALEHQMSLWDCLYVALAVEHDCPFLTADRRLFRSGLGRHHRLRLLE